MKINGVNIIFLFFYLIIILCIDNPTLFDINKNKLKKEIIIIEKYFKICNNGILLSGKNKMKKVKNPIISIISAVYNKENYIKTFLRSIQNQNYDEIEIILTDDYSKDNTVNIIENIQKEDERIILLKHKKNKGTLISRNEGILFSKGKYIIIPDSDDLLSSNILKQSLMIAEEKNYDFIRFNTYLGNKDIFFYNKIKNLSNQTINQPELSSLMFYGLGYLKLIDPMISNKFIKRNILINTLNSINRYFLTQNMIFYEDTLINYIIYKTSKSYYYLKNIGYFYVINPKSSTNSFKNEKSCIRLLYSFFIFLKFIFENTKNNKYEKNMLNEILEKEKKIILLLNKNIINKYFSFFKNIINLYLSNKYIKTSMKKMLKRTIEIKK